MAILSACAGGYQEKETVINAKTEENKIVTVRIEPGEHYTHKIRIFPLIHIKAAPQIAVWAENAQGEFITTLFITETFAKQSWRKAPGDKIKAEEIRRPEALPVFESRRSSIPENTDRVSGATPMAGKTVETVANGNVFRIYDKNIYIFAEINSSLDFNNAYSREAKPGTPGYSGGDWGSGQPSLLYSAKIDLSKRGTPFSMKLIGHGSPDGSSGTIYTSTDGITTALKIVDTIYVEISAE